MYIKTLTFHTFLTACILSTDNFLHSDELSFINMILKSFWYFHLYNTYIIFCFDRISQMFFKNQLICKFSQLIRFRSSKIDHILATAKGKAELLASCELNSQPSPKRTLPFRFLSGNHKMPVFNFKVKVFRTILPRPR